MWVEGTGGEGSYHPTPSQLPRLPPAFYPPSTHTHTPTPLPPPPPPPPPQAEFEDLGRQTEGFSGSDIAVVVKDVLMQPVRKTQVGGGWNGGGGGGAGRGAVVVVG